MKNIRLKWNNKPFYNQGYSELHKILSELLNPNNKMMFFCIIIKLSIDGKIYERSLTKVYAIKYDESQSYDDIIYYILNEIENSNLDKLDFYSIEYINEYFFRYKYSDVQLDSSLVLYNNIKTNIHSTMTINNSLFRLPNIQNIDKWGIIDNIKYINNRKLSKNRKINMNIIKKIFNNNIYDINYNVIEGHFIKNKIIHVVKQYIYQNLSIIIIKPIQNLNMDNKNEIIIIDIKTNNNKFTRYINNKVLLIENNIIIQERICLQNNYLKGLNIKNEFINNKIYTLDIETLLINNNDLKELIPYCICLYNGQQFSYKYGLNCIKELFVEHLQIKAMNKQYIYVHNQSKFDFVYLLKELCDQKVLVDIIPNHSGINLIKCTIHYNYLDKNIVKTGVLYLYDSYLILPSSLNKLAQDLNINMKKLSFPYEFMDNINKLTFNDYLPHEYNIKGIWSAKENTLKYICNDVELLYKIQTKFNERINIDYGINIYKYPTLASLALAIYRKNYYKNNIINLKGIISDNIRQAYYGGEVNVYIPEGHNLYCYDINSLYPYCMLKPLPSGPITYVKNHIHLSDFFGFLHVNIQSPKDLFIPFLPYHDDNYLLCPLGEWSGWYFSEEQKYAEKLGYKITINEGYSIEKGEPFKKYVNDLYRNKSNLELSKFQRNIYKLLLNSLYGRMGMKDKKFNVKLLSDNEQIEYIKNNINLNLLLSFDDKALCQFEQISHDLNHNFSNIAIAAAITAYARIEIYKYKNIPGNQCYYSDTDSVFLQYPLSSQYISNQIGSMKQEYKAKEAIFIAPKSYYILKDNNDEIVKIKGYTNKLSKNDFKTLLIKDTHIEKSHNIFKKDLKNQKINIINQPYLIKIKNNKRDLIYDSNNKFISTLPKFLYKT